MAGLAGAWEAAEAAVAVGDGLAPRTHPGGLGPRAGARRRERSRGDRDRHTPRADASGTQTHGARRVAGRHASSPRGAGHGGGASFAGCRRSGCPRWVSLLPDPDVYEQNLENLRRTDYAPHVRCATTVRRFQGAKPCAPSQATFPSMRWRPERPACSRPRRRGSFAGRRPYGRSLLATRSTPSLRPSTLPTLPSANGGNALPTRARPVSWIVLVLDGRAQSRAHAHHTATASSITTRCSTARAPPHGAVAHWRPWWRTTPGSRVGAQVSAWS